MTAGFIWGLLVGVILGVNLANAISRNNGGM